MKANANKNLFVVILLALARRHKRCFRIDLEEKLVPGDICDNTNARELTQASGLGYVPKDLGLFGLFYKNCDCGKVFESCPFLTN